MRRTTSVLAAAMVLAGPTAALAIGAVVAATPASANAPTAPPTTAPNLLEEILSPPTSAARTTAPPPTTTPPRTASGGGTKPATSRPATAPAGQATTTSAPPPTSTTSTTLGASAASPAMVAQSDSINRTPPSSTSALLAALSPLEHLGLSPEQAEILGMGQFPVGGPAYYADDFWQLRPGPSLHQGIDIVASTGTLLRSPIDGVLRYDTSDPTGYGLAAIVTAPDGTFYLMGHLSATVQGLASGTHVHEGQPVGFVGATGDATGPHCHFEIHPQGGAAIDAKPILDAWQAQAIAAIPALVAALEHKPAPGAHSAAPAPPTTSLVLVPTFPGLLLAAPVLPIPSAPPFLSTGRSGSHLAAVAVPLVALLAALAALSRWWPAPFPAPLAFLGRTPLSPGRRTADAGPGGGEGETPPDQEAEKGSEPEDGEDQGEPEAGEPDAGEPEAGEDQAEPEAGEPEVGEPEAGPVEEPGSAHTRRRRWGRRRSSRSPLVGAH